MEKDRCKVYEGTECATPFVSLIEKAYTDKTRLPIMLCGGRNVGRTYIFNMLKDAVATAEAFKDLVVEAEKQELAIIQLQEEFASMLKENNYEYSNQLNYEPSVVELKAELKHEKNYMRQQQLRKEIAKLEFQNRRINYGRRY